MPHALAASPALHWTSGASELPGWTGVNSYFFFSTLTVALLPFLVLDLALGLGMSSRNNRLLWHGLSVHAHSRTCLSVWFKTYFNCLCYKLGNTN